MLSVRGRTSRMCARRLEGCISFCTIERIYMIYDDEPGFTGDTPKDIFFIHVSYGRRNNKLAKRYCVNRGNTEKASDETAYIKS